jgi:NADPH2:quinone reductase
MPRPIPAAEEVLVRIEAAGVNFIDVYHRTGLYKLPMPFVPGYEGAGVVVEAGDAVRAFQPNRVFQPNERVAWTMAPGAYAEYAVVPAARLVRVPAAIDSRTAAAAMLQGMTAHYLSTDTYALGEGKTALVHAAAGGVGALLVQMAKLRGARVFGTASTSKLDLVRDAGADAVIDYTTSDFKAEVLSLTGGAGVNVVYDSVGKTTFDGSLDCAGRRGCVVLFGQSSGTVAPLDLVRLAKNGIYVTRPSLAHYTATPEELAQRAAAVFDLIASGRLRLRIDRELPLREAAEAHRLLEGRKAAGKLLLIP